VHDRATLSSQDYLHCGWLFQALVETDPLSVRPALIVGGGVDETPAAVHCPDGAYFVHGCSDQTFLERDQCAWRDGGLSLLILELPGNG